MSARVLALAAACVAACATAAAAEDGPPGPGGGFPPSFEGGFPPGPGGGLPPGFGFGDGEGGPPKPPITCGDEVPGELPELPEGEPELRVTDEGEEPPFAGCLPFELDGPAFMPGFLKRAWRFRAEANGFADGMLDVTITKFSGLPKKFRDQDDELIDEFAFVLVGAKTRVIDADGERVKGDDRDAALDAADEVRATGKLLAPGKWKTDEDDEPVATLRAKRIAIED